MYAGLMVDDAEVNVLEFNCRFGDPESQAVLPRLEGDLLAALTAAASGEPIADDAITWSDEATVAVAMASGGYPGSYATGAPITGWTPLTMVSRCSTQARRWTIRAAS